MTTADTVTALPPGRTELRPTADTVTALPPGRTELRPTAGLMSMARQRASELLVRAREEAAALRTTATAAGYQDGLAAGHCQVALEVANWKAQADGVLEQVREAAEARLQANLASLEPHLLELVMTVVRQVVKQEVEQNREVIRRQVEAAVAALGKSMVKTIRVNPGDLNHLLEAGLSGLALVGDTGMQAGGCVVEGPGITVDASIETQLSRLEGELKRHE